jgi:hypothetical protein
MSSRNGRKWNLLGFAICLVATACCAAWAFHATNLAKAVCDSGFSLLSDDFRCRQPYLALICVVTLGNLGFYFLRKLVKQRPDDAV